MEVRGSGPADRDKVIAAVRARLGWTPLPDPTPHPAELIPPDAPRDIAETRRLLKAL